jgi:two-component system, OmpR family, alkaline phosphatase synthesis response regulator PhoP
MPKILVVDDEVHILDLVRLYMEREGYRVETAAKGSEGLEKLTVFNPDIVLLDLTLPDIDGFNLCRQIRQKSNVPIVMLTARREDYDKIIGLELGADDYVTKPFNPLELSARIKAVLRRYQMGQPAGEVAEIGRLRIDLSRHEASIAGRPITLRTKEFALLAALVHNPGFVFSREKLLEIVWGFDYYGETRTVDVHVNHLREKLTGSGVNIETLRGSGYRMTVKEGT